VLTYLLLQQHTQLQLVVLAVNHKYLLFLVFMVEMAEMAAALAHKGTLSVLHKEVLEVEVLF
jgi:hypothetical protein